MPENYLHRKIELNVASKAEVKYSIKLSLPIAIKIGLKQFKKGSEPWLRFAQYWGKEQVEIAKLLSEFYLNNQQVKHATLWFEITVGLNFNDKHKSLDDSYMAVFIQLLMNENRYQVVKNLALQLVPNFYTLKALLEISMIEGDAAAFSFTKTQLIKLGDSSDKGSPVYFALNNFLQKIDEYKVPEFFKDNSRDKTIDKRIPSGNRYQNCIRSFQFLASDMNDLIRVESFIKQIEKSELKEIFCFSPPRYISKQTLGCSDNDNGKVIECTLNQWAKFANTISEDYVGVIVANGKANVKGGILYIDKGDNLSVVKHELLHLLGFVDEYALKKEHPFCEDATNESNAHNVAIIPEKLIVNLKHSTADQRLTLRQEIYQYLPWANKINPHTPVFHKTHEQWRVGTPENYRNEVGIYVSKTCENHGVTSVKPINAYTALEYFDETLPKTYLELYKQEPTKHLKQNFYYQISQTFMAQGKSQLSEHWYKAAKEKDSARNENLYRAELQH